MIRDPAPAVVALDLQAALVRCGIEVKDVCFVDAAMAAMDNIVRAWLYGIRKVAMERMPDDPGTAVLEIIDRLNTPYPRSAPWPGNNDIAVRGAVAAVGVEGQDLCARTGRGLNFPPSCDVADRTAVSLDPPCAYLSCTNRLTPGARYAARQPFRRPGWLPADAGQGLTPAALAHVANEPAAAGCPAASLASAADTASASVPEPNGDGPRSLLTTAGASVTSHENCRS